MCISTCSLVSGALCPMLLGAIGWLLASFFVKPLLHFSKLRAEVHEELIFSDNVSSHDRESEPARYLATVNALRRLGAKIEGIDVSAVGPFRIFLRRWRYDLRRARTALLALSNSLAERDGSRAIYTNGVQIGLRLPRTYDDDEIRRVQKRIGEGGPDFLKAMGFPHR